MIKLNTHFQIDRATKDDRQELLGVALRSWQEGIQPLVEPEPGLEMRERQRFRKYIESRTSDIVVAHDANGIAGWISHGLNPEYVAFLFVSPVSWRRGVGTLLLSRFETMAVLAGLPRIILDTLAQSEMALQFYLKNGFRPARDADALAIRNGTPGGVKLIKALTTPSDFMIDPDY